MPGAGFGSWLSDFTSVISQCMSWLGDAISRFFNDVLRNNLIYLLFFISALGVVTFYVIRFITSISFERGDYYADYTPRKEILGMYSSRYRKKKGYTGSYSGGDFVSVNGVKYFRTGSYSSKFGKGKKNKYSMLEKEFFQWKKAKQIDKDRVNSLLDVEPPDS